MMRGYKVFNPDWTCRNKRYSCPGIFEEDGDLSICEHGMHFCKRLVDCFNYYNFNPKNKVAEVIAFGDIRDNGEKCCTNKLKIERELMWNEVLEIVNSGVANSGNRNSGNWNSGNRNSGNWNSGNRNSGNWNSGNFNSGDFNSGDFNSGDRNSGDFNSGDFNSGDRNSGDFNSGDRNSGNWNSGNRNSGNWNSGNWNSGNRNSGNWNSGNFNSGDWNSGDWNSGCFNTKEAKINLFNKPSDWTYQNWINSAARELLNEIPKNVVEWIYVSDMTDEEKAENPSYKTTGGYLKVFEGSDCAQLWWDGLTEEKKDIIKALPNFEADIFKECTGIDIGDK